MGSGTGTAAAREGIHACIGALDELFLAEVSLDVAAGAGGDVQQRAYEIRLERSGWMNPLQFHDASVLS